MLYFAAVAKMYSIYNKVSKKNTSSWYTGFDLQRTGVYN